MSIVKTKNYICTKHCDNCPFLDDGKKMHLRPGRVDSIKSALLRDDRETFNCHKTTHNKKIDKKMCYGAILFLEKRNRPNIIMRLNELLKINIEKDIN